MLKILWNHWFWITLLVISDVPASLSWWVDPGRLAAFADMVEDVYGDAWWSRTQHQPHLTHQPPSQLSLQTSQLTLLPPTQAGTYYPPMQHQPPVKLTHQLTHETTQGLSAAHTSGYGGVVASQPEQADAPQPEPTDLPTRAGKSIGRPPFIISVKPEDISILFTDRRRAATAPPPLTIAPVRKRGGGSSVVSDAETLLPMPMVSGSFTPRWGLEESTAAPAVAKQTAIPADSDWSPAVMEHKGRDRSVAGKQDARADWTDNRHGDDSGDSWWQRHQVETPSSDHGDSGYEDSDDDNTNSDGGDTGDSVAGSSGSTPTVRDTTTQLDDINLPDGGGQAVRKMFQSAFGNNNATYNDDLSVQDNNHDPHDGNDGGQAKGIIVSNVEGNDTADGDQEEGEDDHGGEHPRAEASNDAPASYLVSGGSAIPENGAADGEEEEGRSLDIARSAAGDRAHRIIISQQILRDAVGGLNGGGSGGLTLEIGASSGRSRAGGVLDISNMIAIVVGILGFLLIVCGGLAALVYRRRYLEKSQGERFSNCDTNSFADSDTFNSISYADCAGIEFNKDNSSEELYSLDNDSFLNSLETMTFPESWPSDVKHTNL